MNINRAERSIIHCAVLFAAFAFLIPASPLAASETSADNGSEPSIDDTAQSRPPIWIVLYSSQDAQDAQEARRFIEELSLISMDAKVTSMEMQADYFEKKIPNQLLDSRIEGIEASYLLWLNHDHSDGLQLVIVPVNSNGVGGDSHVHTLHADGIPALALAAKEMLIGLAVQFQTQSSSPEFAQKREESDEPQQVQLPTKTRPAFRDDLGMGVLLGGGGGIFGGAVSPYWSTGGGLFFQYLPSIKAALRFHIAGGIGPIHDTKDVSLLGRWMEIGVSGLFLAHFKPIFFGPSISVSALFNSLKLTDLVDSDNRPTLINNWNVKANINIVLAIAVGEYWRIALEAGVDGRLFRYHYEIQRTKKDVLVTPIIGWQTQLTAMMFLPAGKK